MYDIQFPISKMQWIRFQHCDYLQKQESLQLIIIAYQVHTHYQSTDHKWSYAINTTYVSNWHGWNLNQS